MTLREKCFALCGVHKDDGGKAHVFANEPGVGFSGDAQKSSFVCLCRLRQQYVVLLSARARAGPFSGLQPRLPAGHNETPTSNLHLFSLIF
jgi:hypothetical protein